MYAVPRVVVWYRLSIVGLPLPGLLTPVYAPPAPNERLLHALLGGGKRCCWFAAPGPKREVALEGVSGELA